MRRAIQFTLSLLLMVFVGCKKPVIYSVKYNKEIYSTHFFKSNCGKLFDQSAIILNIDSFNRRGFYLPRHPIYSYCKDQLGIIRALDSTASNRSLFYLGDLNHSVNNNIQLFMLDAGWWTTGYFYLKQRDGFAILRCFDTQVDTGKTLESRYRDGFMLLWEETDWSYDIVDESKQKVIQVVY